MRIAAATLLACLLLACAAPRTPEAPDGEAPALPDRAAGGSPAVERPAAGSVPEALPEVHETYEVVRSYPHDPLAFTQGLAYHEGFLYEGTGRRGQSSLRRVRLETGEVLERVDLPGSLFGEGITILDGRIYQLTWLSGTGFVYDLASLRLLDRFRQVADGWGLTHDGAHLIQSDGSARLYFVDPASSTVIRRLEVRDAAGPVDQLNELEMVDGEIYANVWHSDEILRISPRSGEVIGRIDMRGLLDRSERPDPEAVLNGIAYDRERGRLFVTGKLWPRLFEVRVVRVR